MKKTDSKMREMVVANWKRHGSKKSNNEYSRLSLEFNISSRTIIRILSDNVSDLSDNVLNSSDNVSDLSDNTGHELDSKALSLSPMDKAVISSARRAMDSYITDSEKEYISRFDAAPKTSLGYIATQNARVWF